MAVALSDLPALKSPSSAGVDKLLDGLEVISARVGEILETQQPDSERKLVNF